MAAAVAFALLGGFGLGGALFLAVLLGLPLGGWWAAAGHAHGHVQLFGWAGLMVFGVGLHFLPRLRGRRLARPSHARIALALLASGLGLRLVSQPWLALAGPSPLPAAGLALSGALELGGASVALGLLVGTLRGDPPLRSRPGLVPVLPLFAASFAGLWLALAANLLAVARAVLGGTEAGVVDDQGVVLVALYGFLVPISVGMGARLFPLHYATHLPNLRLLRFGLGLLLAGLALRLAGEAADGAPLTAGGLAGTAAALSLFIVGLRVFAPRRDLPGRRTLWYADAAQWHGLSAFAWLALDAGLLLVVAASLVLGSGWDGRAAEPHVLGAGFVTLLILGEGATLLPGFARRPLRSGRLVWATLVLGNLAAGLRVGPVLLPALFPASAATVAPVASGLAGLLAVALFAANLSGPPERAGGPPEDADGGPVAADPRRVRPSLGPTLAGEAQRVLPRTDCDRKAIDP